MHFEKSSDSIKAAGVPILEAVSDSVTLVADATATGVFLHVEAPATCQFWPAPLGTITALDRFTACYRKDETFWMEPCAGTTIKEIPGDTQWLLVRRTDGKFVLVVPILDGALRFCLDGTDGKLRAWANSGDAFTVQAGGAGVYLAVGDDPYLLQEQGAVAVLARLQTGTLRRDKPLPDFVDWLGWCTWNSFYQDVSAPKVRDGLESFRAGGVEPGYLILDDGWQSTDKDPRGGQRLTSLAPNEKFPGGLAPLVHMAKEEFGIKRFIAWHAVMGYWGGLARDKFPEYNVQDVIRRDMPNFGRNMAEHLPWMGLICGAIPPDRIAAFYDDLHASLVAQGVDGVKVDNQSSLELSVTGLGSRVAVTQAYREGLEASCRKHFDGRLINCMSNANETHLMARDSALLRTSTDFWPLRPETHGTHLYTDAQVDMWFGELIHPDWDMFETGHEMGAYHAASRAISGSPIYVSDKPHEHDFDVLRKLTCADGSILRCTGIGRPSPDCLLHDPTREDVLLKIFNFNRHGAVLGVFHARHNGGAALPIAGAITLADVPGLPPGDYAVLAHTTGEVRILGAGSAWPLELAPAQWELFTLAPLTHGRAILGLAGKYNSGGALRYVEHTAVGIQCRVADGGRVVFHAATAPVAASHEGVPVTVEFDATNQYGTVNIDAAGELRLIWETGR